MTCFWYFQHFVLYKVYGLNLYLIAKKAWIERCTTQYIYIGGVTKKFQE
jgi:hypothetical protein